MSREISCVQCFAVGVAKEVCLPGHSLAARLYLQGILDAVGQLDVDPTLNNAIGRYFL